MWKGKRTLDLVDIVCVSEKKSISYPKKKKKEKRWEHMDLELGKKVKKKGKKKKE